MKRRGPVASFGVLALSVAWVFAGFRNLPRLSEPSSAAAGLVIAVCLLVAYRAGAARVKSEAVAVAVAKAEAAAVAAAQSKSQASANVIVINDRTLGAAEAGRVYGLEDAPWLQGRHRAIDLDETEALDTALEDVLSERESERA